MASILVFPDDFQYLKAHCHDDFAVFWSKPLNYFTKNLFYNIKLLLQHQEENTKVFLLATSLKYTGRT